jgi:hypothetical protein
MGHLAAAVRIRLRYLRLPASDMDWWINTEPAALFLACSDFENTSFRRALIERARRDHATLLFACLKGHTARVGPLITPVANEIPVAHHLTRSWDFSPEIAHHTFPAQHTDKHLTHLAQIGATFVVGELANLLCARVTKIDSPHTNSSDLPPQGLPEVNAGTLVATDVASEKDWRQLAHLPTRTWHPALV